MWCRTLEEWQKGRLVNQRESEKWSDPFGEEGPNEEIREKDAEGIVASYTGIIVPKLFTVFFRSRQNSSIPCISVHSCSALVRTAL